MTSLRSPRSRPLFLVPLRPPPPQHRHHIYSPLDWTKLFQRSDRGSSTLFKLDSDCPRDTDYLQWQGNVVDDKYKLKLFDEIHVVNIPRPRSACRGLPSTCSAKVMLLTLNTDWNCWYTLWQTFVVFDAQHGVKGVDWSYHKLWGERNHNCVNITFPFLQIIFWIWNCNPARLFLCYDYWNSYILYVYIHR